MQKEFETFEECVHFYTSSGRSEDSAIRMCSWIMQKDEPVKINRRERCEDEEYDNRGRKIR